MIEEIEEYCTNKTVCIVGPAELDENLSEFIDSHDVVVRMNTYKKITDINYGKKNDIYIGSFLYNCDIDNDFKYMIVLTNDKNSNNNRRMEKVKKYPKYKNIAFLEPSTEDDIVFLNICQNKTDFTTGTKIVLLFLHIIEKMQNLSIIGMSFGLTSYNILYHGVTNENYEDLYKEDRNFIAKKIKLLNDLHSKKIYIENKTFKNYIEQNLFC